MAQTIITTPDTASVELEHSPIVARAKALTVRTVEEHGIGQEILVTLSKAERRVEDLFREPKSAAFKAHRAITEAERKLISPITEAKAIVSRTVTAFEIEQTRKAEEERRRLQEEARKAEEERALADAIEAEASGDMAVAAEILEAPPAPPVVTVEPQLAKVDGVSSRTNYRAEVIDAAAFLRYVGQNADQWTALAERALPELNRLAKAMRDGFKVPGVRLVKETIKAVRTA